MDDNRVPDHVAALRRLIQTSNNIVVFTGAGISTESGIPDFRGPKGVWNTQTPIDFRDFVASEDVRRESWRRKFSGELNLEHAAPNAGHLAITSLVEVGKISSVITQNVDGLHQKSGTPDDMVIELHGNASYAACLSCEKRLELEPIKSDFDEHGTIPYCADCGGIVKTATISFGQSMPVIEMQKAETASLNCDLFIAIGSSLVVYPAAGFPRMAKDNGAALVIINEQETDLDPFCDLVLHEQIGATLSQAVD
ncbi:MAG: SIR2 family NAD-dependent protein deacylase [Candidatus Azotimanducaceae bacterium WSBS_2022_MAG_OTU7]